MRGICHHRVNYAHCPLPAQLIKDNKIVVFMKGTPAHPQCGFSNAVMQIFQVHGMCCCDWNLFI